MFSSFKYTEDFVGQFLTSIIGIEKQRNKEPNKKRKEKREDGFGSDAEEFARLHQITLLGSKFSTF